MNIITLEEYENYPNKMVADLTEELVAYDSIEELLDLGYTSPVDYPDYVTIVVPKEPPESGYLAQILLAVLEMHFASCEFFNVRDLDRFSLERKLDDWLFQQKFGIYVPTDVKVDIRKLKEVENE